MLDVVWRTYGLKATGNLMNNQVWHGPIERPFKIVHPNFKTKYSNAFSEKSNLKRVIEISVLCHLGGNGCFLSGIF